MKKSLLFPVFAVLFALASTSCNRFYKNPDFKNLTAEHHSIAVLPYEIIITGRQPKSMTEEKRRQIEEQESLAFQKSMVNMIHAVGARGRRDLTVKIQPAEKTAAILAENGISVRDSWNADPEKLAKLLGVDAVIRSRATKQRFLSDAESFGIEAVGTVLGGAVGAPIFAPSRTNEVEVSTSIISAADGETLFTGRDEITVNWTRPANEAIEQINRRVCRRFPYVDK